MIILVVALVVVGEVGVWAEDDRLYGWVAQRGRPVSREEQQMFPVGGVGGGG